MQTYIDPYIYIYLYIYIYIYIFIYIYIYIFIFIHVHVNSNMKQENILNRKVPTYIYIDDRLYITYIHIIYIQYTHIKIISWWKILWPLEVLPVSSLPRPCCFLDQWPLPPIEAIGGHLYVLCIQNNTELYLHMICIDMHIIVIMCVYIYIHAHTHTHTHVQFLDYFPLYVVF